MLNKSFKPIYKHHQQQCVPTLHDKLIDEKLNI